MCVSPPPETVFVLHTGAILPPLYEKSPTGAYRCVRPAQPCPEILTSDEAVRFLRLDETEAKDPKRTLDRYRREGRLKGIRIGQSIRYKLDDVRQFVNQLPKVPNPQPNPPTAPIDNHK